MNPNDYHVTMDALVSLCKRRGFIFQTSEIYGGINGFWDYGPLGVEMKRNIKSCWWKSMTQLREDIVGLDISPAMLKLAKRLETYDRLYEQNLGRPIPEAENSFAAVTCFGSLGPGHAPPDCLDEFIRVTHPGGHVIFNVRPDTYEEQGLRAKIDDLLAGPTVREVGRSPNFRPYLLSEPELGAQIFVFQVV